MAIVGKAGEYGHNNPLYAFVDSNFIRGGGRVVADTTALYALGPNSDQLKTYVTEVYVISLGYKMRLIDISNIGNSSGWASTNSSITIDSTPTSGSNNAVSSGGVYTALAGKVSTSGSYSNPSWITSLDWSKISNTPSFYTQSQVDANFLPFSGGILTGPLVLAGDPVSSLNPVTLGYFLNFQNGLNWKHSVRVGTTTTLPSYTVSIDFLTLTASSNGAFPVIDGVTLTINDYILVKDETSSNQTNNGSYQLTQVGDGSNPWILVRASDSNTGSTLKAATYIITEGTTQADKVFSVNVSPITLGTTNITFVLTGGAGTYFAGAGLVKTDSTFSLDLTYVATSSSTGLLSSSDWTTFNSKEASITSGTTSQYWRGDKTFQTLDTSVVTENGNLYFTTARVKSYADTLYVSLTGSYSNPSWINSIAFSKLTSVPSTLSGFGVSSSDTLFDNKYFLKTGDTISMTNGTGFLGLLPQTSNPTAPTSGNGVRLFAKSTGDLSWIGTNGFVRTFSQSGVTGDHIYSLPDTDGTLSVYNFTGSSTQLTRGDGTYITLGLNDIVTALGFNPENRLNKATDLSSNDDTHYPTVKAINTALATVGTGTYNRSSPATRAVGGISIGDPLSGLGLDVIFEKMLAPYTLPTITNTVLSPSTSAYNAQNVTENVTFRWTKNTGTAPLSTAQMQYRRGTSGSWINLSTTLTVVNSTISDASSSITINTSGVDNTPIQFQCVFTDTSQSNTSSIVQANFSAYAAPSISFSVGTTTRELGDINTTITGTITQNSPNIALTNYQVQYQVNGTGSWIGIGSPTTISGSSASISISHNNSSLVNSTSLNYRVQVTDAQTTTTSSTNTINFVYRAVLGYDLSSTISLTTLLGMSNSILTNSRVRPSTTVTTTNSQYTYIGYDAAAGDLSSIVQNGVIPILGNFNKLTDLTGTNSFGATVTYRVYVTAQPGSFNTTVNLTTT